MVIKRVRKLALNNRKGTMSRTYRREPLGSKFLEECSRRKNKKLSNKRKRRKVRKELQEYEHYHGRGDE
jgi:hypothetical protein